MACPIHMVAIIIILILQKRFVVVTATTFEYHFNMDMV